MVGHQNGVGLFLTGDYWKGHYSIAQRAYTNRPYKTVVPFRYD